MENFPGPNPEFNTGDTGEKSSKKRKTRRLPLTSMLETASEPTESSSEKPAKKSVDRALTELVVRRKLQEGRGSREAREATTETDEALSRDEEAVAVPATELLSSMIPETVEHKPETEPSEEASERHYREERDEGDDAGYELLPDLALGADEFIGDMVVHLRDPIEDRLDVEADTAEISAPDEAATRPPRLTTGGGRSIPPPRRPEMPATPASEPPERPADAMAFAAATYAAPESQVMYQHNQQQPQAASQSAVEGSSGVTKQELNDAIYRATKVGQNRGVATGLLVGAGYEHLKHKKREKKAEKKHQVQVKQFQKAEQANKIYAEEQERRKNELERRLQTTENKLSDVETHFQKQGLQAQPEKQRPVLVPEQVSEQLQVPPEHRVQTSAWHSIEVDARTGRPVENQTFTYGEEYNKERAQELQSGTPGAASPHKQDSPAVSAGGAQQHGGSGFGGDDASLPPLGLPNASMQGPPQTVQRPAKAAPKPQTSSGQQAGPIWPWLVALAAIVICLALILH